MRAFRASLFVVLVASLFPPLARAAGYAELGTLERGAVDAALAARGLTIDPAPAGKIIGTIHVVNLEVFQPGDGGFLFFQAEDGIRDTSVTGVQTCALPI